MLVPPRFGSRLKEPPKWPSLKVERCQVCFGDWTVICGASKAQLVECVFYRPVVDQVNIGAADVCGERSLTPSCWKQMPHSHSLWPFWLLPQLLSIVKQILLLLWNYRLGCNFLWEHIPTPSALLESADKWAVPYLLEPSPPPKAGHFVPAHCLIACLTPFTKSFCPPGCSSD